MSEEIDGIVYKIFGVIIGVITFFACWIYAAYEWGFLLGVGFGWIPSLFIAIIAGFIGPLLIAIGIIILIFAFILNNK